jgi:hypothetical protein
MNAEFHFPDHQKNGLISDKQWCKDHSYDCHQFYQDVECRTRGILERVADRIAGDCCLVCSPSPTTVIPMTMPLENETRKLSEGYFYPF